MKFCVINYMKLFVTLLFILKLSEANRHHDVKNLRSTQNIETFAQNDGHRERISSSKFSEFTEPHEASQSNYESHNTDERLTSISPTQNQSQKPFASGRVQSHSYKENIERIHSYEESSGIPLHSIHQHDEPFQHSPEETNNSPSHSSLSKEMKRYEKKESHKFTSDSKFHRNSSKMGIHMENNFDDNHEEPMELVKSNQDIYHDNGRVPSQFSGQDNHYGNNGKVVRQLPGQSGYHSNEEGISSSVVDSFNGNVNDGSGRRRAQVNLQDTGAFNSQENSNTQHEENGYIDVDDDSHWNRDRTTRRTMQVDGNGGRKSGGNKSSSGLHGDSNGSGESIGEDNRGVDGTQSRGTQTDTGRSTSSNESHSGENKGGRPLSGNSRHTTTRTTTDNYYDATTRQSRTNQSTTEKPSSGCYLPEQPQDGRYELGGCDSPCDKGPGDAVPNTSVLTYTCNSGFVRNGTEVSVCLNDSWYMPPLCLKTCSPLKSTSVDITCKLRGNTVACDESAEPATVAELSCKPSYKIPLTDDPAYREITCLKNGQWDRRLFRCLPKCGTTIAHGNTLVVNGFTAKVGVFPWHVGIYEKKSRQVYEQICAGTLINSNLVVSAAHCFYDETRKVVKEMSRYYVAAGKHNRSWNADEDYVQKSKIDVINIPDRYMGARGNFAQDIALLKLNKPFELTGIVSPVCLDWDNVLEREHLQVGRYGKTVGWGKTANGQASEELQEINLPFISFDQCSSNVPQDFRGYITPDKFCAGYTNGSSLCAGDSGGGLCFMSNGLWYLRGIVSVGPVKNYSCDETSYTAFTYFSHFREWVRNEFLKS